MLAGDGWAGADGAVRAVNGLDSPPAALARRLPRLATRAAASVPPQEAWAEVILQRTRNGVVERYCRRCEGWFPLKAFVKSTAPRVRDGRLGKCKLCFNGGRMQKTYPQTQATRDKANRKRRLLRARRRA